MGLAMRHRNEYGERMRSSAKELFLPDTKLVEESLEAVRPILSPAFLNHSVRTFLRGKAFGEARKMVFDEEMFAVAALFHDIGLFPGQRESRTAFQIAGSRMADRFLVERAKAESFRRAIADSIDYHMQPMPRWHLGSIVGLMQIGAWMDLTGIRFWSLPKEARLELKQFPRLGVDLEFPRLLISTFTSFRSVAGLMFPGRFR